MAATGNEGGQHGAGAGGEGRASSGQGTPGEGADGGGVEGAGWARRLEPGDARRADVEVTDTSDEPGGAVVTRVMTDFKDARLKRRLLPGAYRRGGGPKSPAGRSVASRNALAHGAYSEVPHDLPEYRERLREVRLSLNPSDAVEDSIVQEVSHATWRRDLLARHEKREAALIEHLGPSLGEVARRSGFPHGERHHWLLGLGVDLARVRRELRQLWRTHLYTPASGGLGLGREGVAVFGERPISPMREEDFLRRWDEAVALAPYSGGPLHAALQSDAGEAFQARLWLYRNYRTVNAARDLLTSRLVTEFLGSETLGRARALIDRSVRGGMEALERSQGSGRTSSRGGRGTGGGRRG